MCTCQWRRIIPPHRSGNAGLRLGICLPTSTIRTTRVCRVVAFAVPLLAHSAANRVPPHLQSSCCSTSTCRGECEHKCPLVAACWRKYPPTRPSQHTRSGRHAHQLALYTTCVGTIGCVESRQRCTCTRQQDSPVDVTAAQCPPRCTLQVFKCLPENVGSTVWRINPTPNLKCACPHIPGHTRLSHASSVLAMIYEDP